MALTIHYRFSFHGSEKQIQEKLEWLAVEFLKLPIVNVRRTENSKGLIVDVGPGCEPFSIELKQTNGDKWASRGFTKTAYAKDIRLCHETVVAMLDLCRTAGILEEVHDERE